MSEQHAGAQAALRGPTQHIGHPIRVFGLDGTMILGCTPVLIFPFSEIAWTIAGLNVIAIIIAIRMRLPSSQIPRRLAIFFSPKILPPHSEQHERDHFKPWPY
jgi:hypothetical protein